VVKHRIGEEIGVNYEPYMEKYSLTFLTQLIRSSIRAMA